MTDYRLHKPGAGVMSDTVYRYGNIAVVLLLISAAIYCRLRLLDVPLERDEGGFAYIGQQLLQGVSPYHSGNMKILPGIHFAYAGIMMLFGENSAGIHAGLFVINLTSIIFMYLLARRLLSIEAAAVAAGTFAILSVGESVIGLAAHATHFVVLFVLGGLIALLKGIDINNNKHIFTSGICLGMSILMKQHGIFFCMFAFCYLIGTAVVNKTAFTVTLQRLLIFAIGIIVPYSATCIYMYVNGVFDEFWFWTVTRSIHYASSATAAEALNTLTSYFVKMPLYVKGIWGVALVTSIAIAFCHDRIVPKKWFITVLLVFSMLSILPSLSFYPHHFILILPVLSLLSGMAFDIMPLFTAPVLGLQVTRMMALLGLLTVVSFTLYRRFDYLFVRSPYYMSRSTYGMNPFPESLEIANYLKQNTKQDTPIAVFGSEPQIYFYANRPSATDYLYMYPLVKNHPYVSIMQLEMMQEIMDSEPEYIVYVNIPTSWLTDGGVAGLSLFEWMDNYLKQYYHQVGLVELGSYYGSKYFWNEDAKDRSPKTDIFILVLRRLADS